MYAYGCNGQTSVYLFSHFFTTTLMLYSLKSELGVFV